MLNHINVHLSVNAHKESSSVDQDIKEHVRLRVHLSQIEYTSIERSVKTNSFVHRIYLPSQLTVSELQDFIFICKHLNNNCYLS